MRRFWIELEPPFEQHHHPGITKCECGVTALDLDDAVTLLVGGIFPNGLPKIRKIVEDVDISTLDERHVLPNMGNVLVRGIWYPLGFTPASRLSW